MLDLAVIHTSDEVDSSWINYSPSYLIWFRESTPGFWSFVLLLTIQNAPSIYGESLLARTWKSTAPNNISHQFYSRSVLTFQVGINLGRSQKRLDVHSFSLFTAEQPDLNWKNPEVRAAVHNVMHFWLKWGIWGYRMDMINQIRKAQNFPDAEPVLEPDVRYHPGVKSLCQWPSYAWVFAETQKWGSIEVLSYYSRWDALD